MVVDFEIFRKSGIWGDCRRVQTAVFVLYLWLICFVILECKISRFLVHFQRPKQNPVNPDYTTIGRFLEMREVREAFEIKKDDSVTLRPYNYKLGGVVEEGLLPLDYKNHFFSSDLLNTYSYTKKISPHQWINIIEFKLVKKPVTFKVIVDFKNNYTNLYDNYNYLVGALFVKL